MGKPSKTEESSSAASASTQIVTPSMVRQPPLNLSSIASSGAPTSAVVHPLKVALESMKSNHDIESYSTAVTTLLKLIGNIISHPMVSMHVC